MISVSKKNKTNPSYDLAIQARIQEDYKTYLLMLQKGSEVGDQDCIYLLALCYFKGYCKLDMDEEKAKSILIKNIDHARSKIFLVDRFSYEYNTNIREWCLSIINSEGNHFIKSLCYKKGLGIDQNKELYFKEILKAADEEDDDEAQYELGTSLLFGFGIKKNETKGIYFLKKSTERGNIDALDTLAAYYYDLDDKFYEQYLYWCKKYSKTSGRFNWLADILNVPSKNIENSDLDSLINLNLARNYLSNSSVNNLGIYLSWYFYKQTKDPAGVEEFQKYEKTIFRGFARCRKITLTLLCIAKYFPRSLGIPGDILRMLAKYVWTTKLAKEWEKNN